MRASTKCQRVGRLKELSRGDQVYFRVRFRGSRRIKARIFPPRHVLNLKFKPRWSKIENKSVWGGRGTDFSVRLPILDPSLRKSNGMSLKTRQKSREGKFTEEINLCTCHLETITYHDAGEICLRKLAKAKLVRQISSLNGISLLFLSF